MLALVLHKFLHWGTLLIWEQGLRHKVAKNPAWSRTARAAVVLGCCHQAALTIILPQGLPWPPLPQEPSPFVPAHLLLNPHSLSHSESPVLP